jgi:hypothetical protein
MTIVNDPDESRPAFFEPDVLGGPDLVLDQSPEKIRL